MNEVGERRKKLLWAEVWDGAEYAAADTEELQLKYEFERDVFNRVRDDRFLYPGLREALANVRKTFVDEARRHLVERVAELLVPS